MQRAAAYYPILGDVGTLQVETLRFLQRAVDAALDAGIARELEPQFAAAGCAVVSNSSAFRMQQDVPLVIPEVNADHIALVERQSWRKNSGGYIVTNPNCSAIGLVVALAPLERAFGIESIFVATMQAVSGAVIPAWPRSTSSAT